ncbi:Transmembrane protein 222 [Acropora cervicornis]|uniref:Transmembrane protein 222 n=1 Tax=Acropora cervicornis TaxID=6130 RepID=A0AAD9QAJ9_ACRCE|nr:Transmembrane protein 222 [Acropora cervicornis]
MDEKLQESTMDPEDTFPKIDVNRSRFPYCIVWTPIPVLTWIFPFIGHMGIGMSSGVIRDFAGPYYVSEDDMAFGKPTKFWRLNPSKTASLQNNWDHNLCCDNCHSHVAMALNTMQYNKSSSWNMVKLCFYMLLYGKYTRSLLEDDDVEDKEITKVVLFTPILLLSPE